MNEGLEVDPNPSSFLPLFFVPHNSTNLSSTITSYHLSLSKLPPTSDNLDVQVRCGECVVWWGAGGGGASAVSAWCGAVPEGAERVR